MIENYIVVYMSNRTT